MKMIGIFIICCIILAAAKAILAVLALAFLLMMLWGLYARTAQTIGYLFTCAVVWFAGAQPKWALAILVAGLVLFAFCWANRSESDTQVGPDDKP